MPASPTIVTSTEAAAFSSTTATVALSAALQAGDVVIVGADTNNGAQVSGVTSAGLTFTKVGEGFSLSVWAAQSTGVLSAPTMTIAYSTEFNTTSTIAVLARGAAFPTPLDPNSSLPAIQTGNPAPPDAVFSTTLPDDLILFWIGCAVGPFGTAPWEDPAITGDNTVGPGSWDWVNGLNNTALLQPIALTVYSQSVSSTQSSVSVGTSATMEGAAYLVMALTADTPASVPINEACGPATPNSIEPMWAAGVGPTPASYTLQWRGPGGGSFTTITGIVDTSVTITGLQPGTKYEWQVEALNASGNSGFSASFFCSTQALFPPTSPPWPPATAQALAKGNVVIGDFRNGNLYLLDLDQPLDNGTQRKWLRTWRAVQKATTKPQRFPALRITMETGIQVPDGTAPQLMLRWSDDGGHTWSNEIIEAAGPTGRTAQSVKFRRTGSTRTLTGLDRILELSSTDRFKVAILAADWEVEGQP